MESLFSLILVGKAKVFVICIVKVKLSNYKCRVGLTGWVKFDKHDKLLTHFSPVPYFYTP